MVEDVRYEAYDVEPEMDELVMVDMNLIVRALADSDIPMEDGADFLLLLLDMMGNPEECEQITILTNE